MNFSVLMSIYFKENPEYLQISLESIWDNQTLKPSEIVLVKDGELGINLNNTIELWQSRLGNILKVIPISENVGLGNALNIGLKHCDFNFIARMDTDDVCVSNRFESQIQYLIDNPNIDIVGGFISEFGSKNGLIKYPLKNDLMRKYFAKRNPIAHVTVMFKKTFFKKAGYYPTDTLFNEDSMLWLNGFKSDCLFANIPQVLVQVRVNDDTFSRRNNFKKVFGDIKDRFKIINELKLSRLNYLYLIGYFMLMVSPKNFRNKVIPLLRYA